MLVLAAMMILQETAMATTSARMMMVTCSKMKMRIRKIMNKKMPMTRTRMGEKMMTKMRYRMKVEISSRAVEIP